MRPQGERVETTIMNFRPMVWWVTVLAALAGCAQEPSKPPLESSKAALARRPLLVWSFGS